VTEGIDGKTGPLAGVIALSSPGSVTDWINRLKDSDQAAAQQLWERYFRQLLALARKKLKGTPCAAADEEDVVQSAFKSLFVGISRGRFPQLSDRDSLWPLLVLITARKALDLQEYNRRQKRGGGRVRGESAWAESSGCAGLEQVLSSAPTPAFAVQAAEECRRLLGLLTDPQLRQVAELKMEGRTNQEVAELIGRSVPTVERKLARIRAAWEREVTP
jgi:RNA polymerase sigma factor (sigma-70 family)